MTRLALVALVACSGGEPSPAPSPSPSPSPAPAPSPAPTPGPPAPTQGTLEAPRPALPMQESFELLAPGSGPRVRLRYRLAADPIEHVVETRLTSRELGAAAPTSIVLAPIRDGFGVSLGAPNELALRALPYSLGESSTGSPLGLERATQYVAAWRDRLQNRRAAVEVDDRGRLGRMVFKDDPANARSAVSLDELAQRLLAMVVPLPDEPVGLGGRWRVVTVLRQGPLYAKQTATYTLRSRGSAGWSIRVELRRVAEEQTVLDPSLPAGARADLVAMFRDLEGEVVVDPRRALIASGALAVESRLHVRVTLPGASPVEQFTEDTGEIAFSTR